MARVSIENILKLRLSKKAEPKVVFAEVEEPKKVESTSESTDDEGKETSEESACEESAPDEEPTCVSPDEFADDEETILAKSTVEAEPKVVFAEEEKTETKVVFSTDDEEAKSEAPDESTDADEITSEGGSSSSGESSNEERAGKRSVRKRKVRTRIFRATRNLRKIEESPLLWKKNEAKDFLPKSEEGPKTRIKSGCKEGDPGDVSLSNDDFKVKCNCPGVEHLVLGHD